MKDDIKTVKKLLRRHPKRTLAGAAVISVICLSVAMVHLLYVPTPHRFKRTTGTVSGINPSIGGGTTSIGYYAVIQFDVNGKHYTFNGNTHTTAVHQKGDKVTVAYFPANPFVGRDLSDHGATLLDQVLIIVGGFGLVFVALWLFKVWWKAEDVPQDAEDVALDAEEAAESAEHTGHTDE